MFSNISQWNTYEEVGLDNDFLLCWQTGKWEMFVCPRVRKSTTHLEVWEYQNWLITADNPAYVISFNWLFSSFLKGVIKLISDSWRDRFHSATKQLDLGIFKKITSPWAGRQRALQCISEINWQRKRFSNYHEWLFFPMWDSHCINTLDMYIIFSIYNPDKLKEEKDPF